jgi:hypothetical protein
MATKKRKSHKGTKRRRRVGAAPAYAVGKPRRKRKRMGATHRRRRRIGSGGGGGMTKSLKDYGMMLLGGGIAEIGASYFITSFRNSGNMPAFATDTVIGAGKVAVGGLTYHMAKNNPFFQGAGIGIGVSGIKEVAKAVLPPGIIGAPDEKTLFITLDKKPAQETIDTDYELVSGDAPIIGTSSSDSPIIGGQAYQFSGDAPIIGADYFNY